MLNWVSMPATHVSGTVFSSLDDDKIIDLLDFTDFEEKFKTLGRRASVLKTDGSSSSPSQSIKSESGQIEQESSLLEPKRIQNVAIVRKKVTASPDVLRQQISM